MSTDARRMYVLAANFQHFAHWCREHNISPYLGNVTYVSTPDILWGVIGDEAIFVFYETWRNHPQAAEILERVRIARLTSRSTPKLEQRMVENDNFWYRLTKLEPAVWRGLIVATVALLTSVGVVISPGVPDALIGFIWAVAAIGQAVWTRGAVTANARVSVLVPDPVNNPQNVEAGEAIATAPNSEIIEAATSNPKPAGIDT